MQTPHQSHAHKVSDERLSMASGKELGDFLLAQFPESNKESPKWKMFAEMISRITSDVAGNRYARAQDLSQFSYFDQLFEKLKLQGVRDAFHKVLDALPAFTKGIVQTPHPTEVLTRQAIDAEGALHTLLENNHKELFGPHPTTIPEDIAAAMRKLYDELKPLQTPLDLKNEMVRSLGFSEVMFDSLPIVIQTVLDGANRHDARASNAKLSFEDLTKFNFLLQPETWSPGDRDSKPLMTAQMLKEGITLSERSMKQHYIKILAGIAIDFNIGSGKAVKTPDGEDTKTITMNILDRLIASVNIPELREYLEKHVDDESAKAIITQGIDRRNDTINQFSSGAAPKPYADQKEFLDDLTHLRNIEGATFSPYVLPSGRAAGFDKLDALYVQANNFGFRALRSQIRENSEMHAATMVMVLRCLEEARIHIEGWEDDNNFEKATANAMKPEVVNAFLEGVMSAQGDAIRGHLIDKLEEIEPKLDTLKNPREKDKDGDKNKEEIETGKRWAMFYETLKGFQIAAEQPDAIPQYVIAECHDTTDMLTAFSFLKVMEENGKRHDLSAPKVEIVPLFEYRGDIQHEEGNPKKLGAVETIKQAYANNHFRAHHNAITDPHDPAIVSHIRENTPLQLQSDPLGLTKATLTLSDDPQHITVAEAKKRFGIPTFKEMAARGEWVTPADFAQDDKQVEATKLIMYAGSDITKSAGSGGAGLVMKNTNKMRKMLLDLDHPVLLIDYTGVGGGMNRSQPVATAYETTQGRSLRQTPQSIAQKILLQAGRAVGWMLGISPQDSHAETPNNKEKVITAQLNVGNLAALPWVESQDTVHRLNKTMSAYQALYDDPTYAAYLGFTANEFVKLTSYAARPPSRMRADRDDGFPPLVDVSNLRAIGYGAALNASGSCAGLYFGVSDFLDLDDQGHIKAEQLPTLRELYVNDPIAQDRINRATYGVIMADMDTAWQYLGKNRSELLKQGTIDTLATTAVSLGDNPDRATREQAALHILAKIDKEYQRASKGLLELHRDVKKTAGLPFCKKTGLSDAAKLLEEQPEALKSQLHNSKWHLGATREYLAKRFVDLVDHKKQDQNFKIDRKITGFNDIYYSMGQVFETFENAPRAYTRLRWALANEPALSNSLAV